MRNMKDSKTNTYRRVIFADKFPGEDEYETYLVDIQAVMDVPDAMVCKSVTD